MLPAPLKALVGALGFIAGWFLYRPAAAASPSHAPADDDPDAPRGIRNNNPGNIRTRGTRNGLRGADPYRGLIGEDELGYGVFSSPVWGIRAMFRELETGARRGELSIRHIITQWAPPTDNDTESYITSVAQQTGFHPDLVLSERDFVPLVKAIIRHENGRQPYSDELIQQARALA